ncbi:TetR/AcrR family transcriptional regulator [Streptomyces sp. NPDC003036]|uniref:TetR/AcrR family transcriptional regulator n=1 Tax=Streptomyces sp. NPDC003036 TaxID=3154442 RepID=UPI0033A82ED1
MTTHDHPRRAAAGTGRGTTHYRRAEILESGLAVFGALGFDEATVEDITRRAGIAKGTFYLYFDSKDHVLGALWQRSVDALLVRAEAILGDGAPWWDTLDRLLAGIIDHALEHTVLRRIVYRSANARALRICRASDERVIAVLAAFVTRGAQDGAFRTTHPHWAGRMLYRAIDALLRDQISAPAPADAQPLVRSVLESAHRTLGDARPASPPPHPHPLRKAPPCLDSPSPTSTSASATSTARRSGTPGSWTPPASSTAPMPNTASPTAT